MSCNHDLINRSDDFSKNKWYGTKTHGDLSIKNGDHGVKRELAGRTINKLAFTATGSNEI